MNFWRIFAKTQFLVLLSELIELKKCHTLKLLLTNVGSERWSAGQKKKKSSKYNFWGLMDFWRIFEKSQFLVLLYELIKLKKFHILKLLLTKLGMEECSHGHGKQIRQRSFWYVLCIFDKFLKNDKIGLDFKNKRTSNVVI